MVKDVSPDVEEQASKPILQQQSSAHQIPQSQSELKIDELKQQIKVLRKKFVTGTVLTLFLSFTSGYADVVALALHGAFASLLTGNWIFFGLAVATATWDGSNTDLPQSAIDLVNTTSFWWIYLILIVCGILGGLFFDVLEAVGVKRKGLVSMPIIAICHVTSGLLDAYVPGVDHSYSTLHLCPVVFAFGLQNSIAIRGPLGLHTALLTGNTLKVGHGMFEAMCYFCKKASANDEFEDDKQMMDDRVQALEHSKHHWEQAEAYGRPIAAIVGLFIGVCVCGVMLSLNGFFTTFWFEVPLIAVLVLVLTAHDFLLDWPDKNVDKKK